MGKGKKIRDIFPLGSAHFAGGGNITGGGHDNGSLSTILNTLQEGVPESIGTPGAAQLVFTGIGVAGDYLIVGDATDGVTPRNYEFNTAPGLVAPGNVYVEIGVSAADQAQKMRDAVNADAAGLVVAEPNSLGAIFPGINDDIVILNNKENGVLSLTLSVNFGWATPMTHPFAVQGGTPAGQIYIFPITAYLGKMAPALTWFLGGLNRAILLAQLDVTGLDLTNAAGSYCLTAVENALFQTPKAIPNTAVVLVANAVSGDGKPVLNVWALNQDPGPYPSGDLDADDVINMLGVLVLTDQY